LVSKDICLRKLNNGKWIARQGDSAIPELFSIAREAFEAVAPLLRAPGETESKVYACPRCATSMQVDPSAKPRAPAEQGVRVDEADIEAMRSASMEIKHNKEPWFPMTDRRLRRAAEALLARRAALAQNAQGEAVYQAMCTDPNIDEDGNSHEDDGCVWMDVTKADYESLSKRPDIRSRVVYLHTERARVPELQGWTLKLMPDRDDVMAIWACDPDGTYVYLAAAPSLPEDADHE
jgi:hypothetical protein